MPTTSRRNFMVQTAAVAVACAVGVTLKDNYLPCDACGRSSKVEIRESAVLHRGQVFCAKCSGYDKPLITGWHFQLDNHIGAVLGPI